MKKTLCIALLSLSTLFTLPSFAYISGKIATDEKRIYCPEQITCTKDNDSSSCKYSSDSAQYWEYRKQDININRADTYKFSSVNSGYHDNRETMCIYNNKEMSSFIYLVAKEESHIEAYYDKSSQWVTIVTPFPKISCQSDTPNACPLKDRSGLGLLFSNVDRNKSLRITLNNVALPYDYPLSYRSGFISYENAENCWGLKQCKINFDLVSNELELIPMGSVIVDMDDKMKIIKISPNLSSGINIKKIESFNTLEIKKFDDPSAYPALEVDNNAITSQIFVYANDILVSKIIGKGHANVFSYRAAEACPHIKECKISLTTYSGGLIGSVIVDMENDMNILSIQITRPSEIGINKVNDHKVEISYPNFH